MSTLILLLVLALLAARYLPARPRRRRRYRPATGYRTRAYREGRRHGITLDRVYARDRGVCGICHRHVERYEASVDHIYPLVRGGKHTWTNVQLAHRRCNASKGAKLP